jgi:integrase
MSKVSSIARQRHRSNSYDDERYARLVALLDGMPLDETPLGEYLIAEWLPAHEIEVEPTTYRSAEDTVHTFLVPHLGAIPVCALTRDHLRAFHQELLRTPVRRGNGLMKKTTVIRIHATLSSALQKLVDAGRIAANPAWGSCPRLKKSERYEVVVWSPRQVRDFLDFAADDDLYPLWNLMAFTGLRRGEALALQWGDLSQRYMHVAVRRGVIYSRGKRYLAAPKGAQARRVDLVTDTIRALRVYRRKQMRRARTRGKALSRIGFIFTLPSGRTFNPGTATKRFRDLVALSDLPRIRLHDLRHTHASHLLDAGANLKAVQERLGHADPWFTMQSYVHAAPTIQREAVKTLEAYYRNATE